MEVVELFMLLSGLPFYMVLCLFYVYFNLIFSFILSLVTLVLNWYRRTLIVYFWSSWGDPMWSTG